MDIMKRSSTFRTVFLPVVFIVLFDVFIIIIHIWTHLKSSILNEIDSSLYCLRCYHYWLVPLFFGIVWSFCLAHFSVSSGIKLVSTLEGQILILSCHSSRSFFFSLNRSIRINIFHPFFKNIKWTNTKNNRTKPDTCAVVVVVVDAEWLIKAWSKMVEKCEKYRLVSIWKDNFRCIPSFSLSCPLDELTAKMSRPLLLLHLCCRFFYRDFLRSWSATNRRRSLLKCTLFKLN